MQIPISNNDRTFQCLTSNTDVNSLFQRFNRHTHELFDRFEYLCGRCFNCPYRNSVLFFSVVTSTKDIVIMSNMSCAISGPGSAYHSKTSTQINSGFTRVRVALFSQLNVMGDSPLIILFVFFSLFLCLLNHVCSFFQYIKTYTNLNPKTAYIHIE